MILRFLKSSDHLFCRMPFRLGFLIFFFLIKFRLCISDRNTTEVEWYLSASYQEEYDPLPVILMHKYFEYVKCIIMKMFHGNFDVKWFEFPRGEVAFLYEVSFLSTSTFNPLWISCTTA